MRKLFRKKSQNREVFQKKEMVLLNAKALQKNGCEEILQEIANSGMPVTIHDVRRGSDNDYVYCIKLPDNRIFSGFTSENLLKA